MRTAGDPTRWQPSHATLAIEPQIGIRPMNRVGAPHAREEDDERPEPSEHHDPGADCLDDLDDVRDRVLIGHAGNLPCAPE